MSYGLYVELMADEAALRDVGEVERRARRDRWMAGLDRRRPGVGATMASLGTAAVRDAPPALGRAPLVLYVPGSGGSALENVALAELLASKGYVVAAIPSVGAFQRVAHATLRDLEAQARDVRYAIGRLAELDFVDTDKVVVAGWSWGGLAGVLAQMQDPRIDGVVSLDGSIGLHRATADGAADFAPWKATVPYLLMASPSHPDATPAFFEELRFADAYYVTIANAEHTDFTTRWGLLANAALDGTDDFDPGIPKTYRSIMRAVSGFVDRVGGAERSMAQADLRFLEDTPGVVVRHRTALAAPPLPHRFLELLREDPVAAARLSREALATDPSVQLVEEEDLVQLAFELYNRLGRPGDAILVGRFLVELYPQSYSAHGYLAELHRKHGDWASALIEFSAAAALGVAVNAPVSTVRQESLGYYRRMIDDLRTRLSGSW